MYRDRGVTLDMESVSELTADTFAAVVTQNGFTVVLLYMKCKVLCSYGGFKTVALKLCLLESMFVI